MDYPAASAGYAKRKGCLVPNEASLGELTPRRSEREPFMNPTLIILGIQATLRAAQAGADLYREHARDRKVFLPNLELPEGARDEQLHLFLKKNPQLARSHPELSLLWDDVDEKLKTTDPKFIDPAYAIMLQHEAKLQLIKGGKDENTANSEAKLLAAGRMVEQWREDREPPSAMIRMALTLTDIGLEFVASNPSILGVSSRGEKLIAAFAKNMSALIPDDAAAFGAKTDFADRVLGIFLRAGLGTLASNAATAFKDEDIAKILTGVTKPIVEALPKSIEEQIRYRDLVDALAGPSAEAAFRLLAENTETYLGKDFADDTALGAVTSALFEQIKVTVHGASLVDVFCEQGVIRLYQAGLAVAVERPGLFIGEDNSPRTKLFGELLSGAAATLRAHPCFKGPMAASLAAMVVEVVGHNAPALLKLNPEEPWENVATKFLEQVITGLADALNTLEANGSPRGAFKSFSSEQLLEFVRSILTQVAQTPGMLGIRRSEVQSIIAGMAEAMAADDRLLLSADEWIKIAGVAAQRAASNPGRLFGLSTENQGGALAVTVIKAVLEVAGDTWTDRSERPLLFGDTLESALEAVIKALAGNVTAIAKNPNLVEQFLRKLLAKASANPEKFGSDGLIKVFHAFIGSVLASGTLPSDQKISKVLSG